ncbi:MAG: TonB family protein [Myxococcales bacterium]|nr:TonB family protein [Myxococcales bacterium]
MPRRRAPLSPWWLLSLLVHGTILAVGARVTAKAPRPASPLRSEALVSFDAPATAVSGDAPIAGRSAPLVRGGSRSAQNLNADRAGGGGDGQSLTAGRLLAPRAERVNLENREANAVGATQEQRIRTARDRASPQDERRTPNPNEDPWLGTGDGVFLFRLRPAPEAPREGASTQRPPREPGAAETPLAQGDTPRQSPLPAPGATPRPPDGVTPQGSTTRARTGPSRTGRPVLLAGHASTSADVATPTPRDNLEADLLAASLLRNATVASVQDGPRRGAGEGGAGGGGDPGSGAEVGRGGRARAYGEGAGWYSLDDADPRFARYFAEIRRRLRPLWADAFPREEALRLRQGTVILGFVIERDGAVRGVEVQRRSGVDAFDANVLRAISGARLPPIPPSLGWSSLRVRAPFEFRNPAVR